MQLRHQLLASSNLMGFTSKRVVRHAAPLYGLKELRVPNLVYARGVGVFYRKDSYLSPAAKRFIEMLKATAKEIDKEP